MEQYNNLVKLAQSNGRPLVITFVAGSPTADSFTEQFYSTKVGEYPQLFVKRCNSEACTEVATACKITQTPTAIVLSDSAEVKR